MPNNWKTYKLGEITKWSSGGTPPKMSPEYWGGEIPWISAKSLKGRYVYNSDLNVTDAGLKKGSKLALKGSILLLVRGSGLYNDIPVAMATKDVSYNQDVKCVLPKIKELSNVFLLYWFKGNKVTLSNILEATSIGAGKFDMSRLLDLEFSLPSLHEQQSIASILCAIDDKIENNLAINKTLEEMAMALYKHWFVDFGPFQDGEFVESELGMIPKGWEVLRLQDVSTLTAGGDKPKNYSNHKTEDCGIPIYSNGITNEGLFGYTDIARINEESITVSARGTIGYVCLRTQPYLPIVRLIAVVPDKNLISCKYLFFWLINQNISGNGTTQQQLTVPDFKSTKVLIPEIELVNAFTEIVNPYYEKINSNKIENQTLIQLRDTLLPQLISGTVRLKEFRE